MSKKSKWIDDFFTLFFLFGFFVIMAICVCLDNLQNKEIDELEKEKLKLQIELLKLKQE